MTANQVRKLIMVTGENNNKYYDMVMNSDGTWLAKWGRVGVTESTQTYPMEKWDSKYNEKLRKGYKDVTELRLVATKTSSSFLDVSDAVVRQFIDSLQRYAKKSIAENYTVSSESVTQKQIEEAQIILNTLSNITKINAKVPSINQNLLELFQVIPRKMKNVKYHIYEYNTITTREQLQTIQNAIAEEQATLDVMAGQVQIQEQEETIEDKGGITLLEMMGLDIVPVTDGFISTIKNMMDFDNSKFRKAYKVINKKTQSKFDSYISQKINKTVKLFWHGSRNENWLSIMEQGLVLRPTNAIRTGSMFGHGIYFADKCKKSLGYTSLRGSYWASGASDKAYLALYDVHLGNPLKVDRHTSWCSDLTEKSLKAKGNYDSVFALKGADLINNEYIIYNDNQSTIKYIIEVSN
jgi:poly [ADP-ribose] polymerase 2/3/4